MSLVWMEAMLPLGIIAGMLCVMGNAQYYIHKAAHGRVGYSLLIIRSNSQFESSVKLKFMWIWLSKFWFWICGSRSTSATTCGMWPWKEGTRSSSSRPLLLLIISPSFPVLAHLLLLLLLFDCESHWIWTLFTRNYCPLYMVGDFVSLFWWAIIVKFIACLCCNNLWGNDISFESNVYLVIKLT